MSDWQPEYRPRPPVGHQPAAPSSWQRPKAPPPHDPWADSLPGGSTSPQYNQPRHQPAGHSGQHGYFPPPQPRFQPVQRPQVPAARPRPAAPPAGRPRAQHHPAGRVPPVRRRTPPFPSHLVRFPRELVLPRSRRRRSPSLFHVVYLGTHPVALAMSLFISMMAIVFVLCWALLVAYVWAIWAACVTVGWLCRAAAASLLR